MFVMQSDAHDLGQGYLAGIWRRRASTSNCPIAIVAARRKIADDATTKRLCRSYLFEVMPVKKPGQIDPATRGFQKLRIYVNRELDELANGLVAVGAAET
ncbi:MAG: hypothetical protein CM15mP46_6640 [Alphaproteobacteria bacterium]|nr:MAG: hypothetical protein CM15mP46_6640 [Alphaproteobacteria bacterium]